MPDMAGMNPEDYTRAAASDAQQAAKHADSKLERLMIMLQAKGILAPVDITFIRSAPR